DSSPGAGEHRCPGTAVSTDWRYADPVGGDTRRTVEAVWRIESPRLIGALARMTHDLGLAEDFAQDALLAALEQWPAEGIPDNPGAWLMTVAKRRAVDHFRRKDQQ